MSSDDEEANNLPNDQEEELDLDLENTPRRRQPPMSLKDQQRLRTIFVTKEAQSWSRLEKKRYVDEILDHELFKHLNKQQVMRRLNLFCTEAFLRKKYGNLFFKNTIKMQDTNGKENFIPRNILGILKA
jgi:hypothetical protein